MSTVRQFTDRWVRALKARPERYDVSEKNGRGLWIRVFPSGAKSWVYIYKHRGRIRRMTLGTYPDVSLAEARSLHADARKRLREDSVDPGEEKQQAKRTERNADTIEGLAGEYLERHAKRKTKGWQEVQRILDKDVLPAWKRLKAKEVTRRDIVVLLNSIVDRGSPIMANRTLATIRKMFNFAVEQSIVEASPCAGVRAPTREQARDRALSEDEVRAFWAKLSTAYMTEGVQLVLRVQLVTALRPGEVAGACREELDLTTGWWTVPAERSKNKLAHRVHLTPQVLELLARAAELAGDSPYLFPAPKRHSRGPEPLTVNGISHAVRRNREHFEIESFRPHDLRRTAASLMTGMGISRLVVGKLLNHTEPGVIRVYDRHSYDAEKRRALEAWAEELERIVGGAARTENVVAIDRRLEA